MHLGRIEFNIVFVYGLVFRFRLLSTSPLDDAVTFSYGQASAPVRKGLSPFCWCVLSGAPTQALRAWLLSACPSGTKAIEAPPNYLSAYAPVRRPCFL
jgi:hypothetical protein